MLINKKNIITKIAIAIASILFVIILVLVINYKLSSSKISYVAVIDAGSSGSRLHLFKITKHDDSQLPFIQDISAEADKIKPGISSFVSHPDKSGAALQPLLDRAILQIKQQGGNISRTSFVLYATAGMRLLTIEQQKAIYDNIQAILSKYNFENTIVKTISGQEEGIFGWLTVNYLLDHAQSQTNAKKLQNTVNKRLHVPESYCHGVLELGGASTQITYYIKSSNNPKNMVSFIINKQKYTVFAYSFLGLGQDQARIKTRYPAKCYPAGFTILESGETSHLFDWEACRRALLPLLNKPPFEKNTESVSQIIQPLKNNIEYYAISGFSHVFNFFRANTLAKLKENSQLLCSSWAKLKEYDGHGKSPTFLGNYCFNGTYIYTLLVDGYGLNPNINNLVPARNIHGQSTNWALGAALYTMYNRV